jgi:hypothetical protein
MSLYKPKISKKKQLEMKLIRQNLDNPNSLAKLRRNLRTTQNKEKNHMASTMDAATGSNSRAGKTKKRYTRSVTKALEPDIKRYSYHPSPVSTHKFIKFDYLQEERK